MQSILSPSAAAVICTFVAFASTQARAEGVCSELTSHRSDTVLVVDGSSDLTICYHGHVEDDVVTGRPVWLVLSPAKGAEVYSYRIRTSENEPASTGLAAWEAHAVALEAALGALAESGETVGELGAPVGPQPPSADRAVASARALYLGVATPSFHEAVSSISAALGDAHPITDSVRRWCEHLNAEPQLWGESERLLKASCEELGGERAEGAREVAALRDAIAAFHARRATARDALAMAQANPSNRSAQEAAVRALDEGRATAKQVIAAAEKVRPYAHALVQALTRLRDTVHSEGRLRPGKPVFLAQYVHAGNAVLELDVRPIGILAAGVEAEKSDSRTVNLRFPIVEAHYFDVEIGAAYTGGLPPVPTLGTYKGTTIIQGKSVDSFAGLFLAEVEPLRFLYPDKIDAGILRLPVIGIPFTRDPTQNFFVGAGLGWTGVGSVTAGPYFLRELSLRPGVGFNEPLPVGSSFTAVTYPKIQVGYFISLSIDVLGLFHLFVPVHAPTIDAASGRQL